VWTGHTLPPSSGEVKYYVSSFFVKTRSALPNRAVKARNRRDKINTTTNVKARSFSYIVAKEQQSELPKSSGQERVFHGWTAVGYMKVKFNQRSRSDSVSMAH
jgi:hypothetical protein